VSVVGAYLLDVLVEYLIFHEVEALLEQVYVPEVFYVKNELGDASECHLRLRFKVSK
jgi:hypothetical protein